jgi:hypothetical protein
LKQARLSLMQLKVPNLQTRPEATFSPRVDGGSPPELHSGRCRALPHGGRQLSWYFGDSSHWDGLTEGLDGVQ